MSNSDQLKMHSSNLVDTNIEKIAALFPNCITETKDENGELKKAIDFDLLKQELSQVLVEGEQERYRLDWVGKKEAILTANAPIAKTLRPCREESVNFDKTENLFIEGDNLEALKLLQENYLGKVKMIYIDPPYNTGNDFIYEDDFSESTNVFFEKSNQIDEEGNRLISNTESNGRFHSDWLSMMYSRLKLARNLLKDEGLILISIDDNEFSNLKKISDEIFGEKNFLGNFIVKSTPNARNYGHVAKMHEYCLMYSKDIKLVKTYEEVELDKEFKYIDINGGFNIHPLYNSDESFHVGNRRNLYYPFYLNKNISIDKDFYSISLHKESEDDIEVYPPKSSKNNIQFVWRWGKDKARENLNKEIVGYQNEDGSFRIVRKMRHTSKIVRSMFLDKEYSGRRGTSEVEDLFNAKYFTFPKPLALIRKLLEVTTKDSDLILDFFAGSSTTAHAVMQLNAEDNGNRKFIMVQLPEQTDEKSEAYKSGYNTIAEISKERIRRAGKQILEDNATKEGIDNLDIGFRVLKIDSTNMKDVYYTPDAYTQADILDLADHIKADRTSEDLLFQVMLDWGLELSLPIERKTIQGKEVFYVAGNSLVACFDDLTFDVVDEVAKDHPLRFVSAEKAIHLDHDKTNIKERFKQLSRDTEVKFI